MERETNYLPVWQCVGCGRIEMPQTCIGVCRDKKVFLVARHEHERALAEIARLQNLLAATRSRLLRFAQCTPHCGKTEATFAALKEQVQQLVGELRTGSERQIDLSQQT